MKKKTLFLLLITVIISNKILAQDKIIGLWQTENKEAKVEIYKSGNLFFGKIISVLDIKNSSKIGLIILKEFIANGNEYSNGTITEPRHNHTAKGKLILSDNGLSLKVTAIAFWGLIAKTETWIKVK